MVHDVVDFPDFPLLRLVKGVVQGFPEKLLGAYGAAGVAVKVRLYHPGLGVLRHEIPLVFFEIAHHFRAERQLKIPAAVNRHGFCPDLCKIGSGSGFVLQNVNLGLFRVHHDRQEAPVAGTVKGQEVKGIGSAAEHTLPQPVLRVGFVWDFIDLLLSAQKRLDFLNALGVCGGDHLRHLDNPMALQLAVHIVIVQLAKVIGKPLVFHGQQPEKGGFSGSLTAHQTEHDLKLAAGMKCPVDGSQQEQPQGFIGVLVAVGS